jgi:hypothetical protein
VASAFDPTLGDPRDQLRFTVRPVMLHSAGRPERHGLMNIEGRQDTERLAYIYDNFIQPALEPIRRLLDHLAADFIVRAIAIGRPESRCCCRHPGLTVRFQSQTFDDQIRHEPGVFFDGGRVARGRRIE